MPGAGASKRRNCDSSKLRVKRDATKVRCCSSTMRKSRSVSTASTWRMTGWLASVAKAKTSTWSSALMVSPNPSSPSTRTAVPIEPIHSAAMIESLR